jgi:hypothetical protein
VSKEIFANLSSLLSSGKSLGKYNDLLSGVIGAIKELFGGV